MNYSTTQFYNTDLHKDEFIFEPKKEKPIRKNIFKDEEAIESL